MSDYKKATPYPMRNIHAWACYKSKDDKAPVNAKAKGMYAKINDKSTWSSFSEACAAADKNGYDGICFATGSGVLAIDLDGCIDENGKVSAEAQDIIDCMDSYTEKSVSGRGIHIFIYGKVPGERNKNGKFEMYSDNHFMIVTGGVHGAFKKMRRPNEEELKRVYDKYINPEPEKKVIKRQAPVGEKSDEFIGREIIDNDLINIMEKSKSGGKFMALYRGDWSGYKPNTTGTGSSEADYALLKLLAYFTGSNAGQMERIFRNSGLYRVEKGDKYLERSIDKASESQRRSGNYYNKNNYFKAKYVTGIGTEKRAAQKDADMEMG